MFAQGCGSRCPSFNARLAIRTVFNGPRCASPRSSQYRKSSTSSAERKEHERIIFSGIQPTGIPHLGNYLGALREWVRLQNESPPGTKLIFSIVDLHALTVPQDPLELRRQKKEMLAALLAVGLDPKKSTLFYQSAVPAHSELMWILSTVSSMGYLSRMTQWKSKLKLSEFSTLEDERVRSKLKLGLFSYPVLQAADVLVHRATHVPVGEDQKQHIEFLRDVANSFNYLHGRILTLPEASISPAKRVMSLKDPTQKMSKSDNDPRSRILISDTPEEIGMKIKQALTDSLPKIWYDPAMRPGVSNLIGVLAHVDGKTVGPEELAAAEQFGNIRILKEHVATRIVESLSGVRERYMELMDNPGYLDEVAEKGAEEARANARITMDTVRNALGI